MLALQEPYSLLASELRLFDADQAGVLPANADSDIENDSAKIVIQFPCFAHGFRQLPIGSVAGRTIQPRNRAPGILFAALLPRAMPFGLVVMKIVGHAVAVEPGTGLLHGVGVLDAVGVWGILIHSTMVPIVYLL